MHHQFPRGAPHSSPLVSNWGGAKLCQDLGWRDNPYLANKDRRLRKVGSLGTFAAAVQFVTRYILLFLSLFHDTQVRKGWLCSPSSVYPAMQEHHACEALMTLPTLFPPVSLLWFLRGGWFNTLTDKTRGLERTNALPKTAQPVRNRAKAQSQGCLAASLKITLGALEGAQGDPNQGSSSCSMYPEWCILVDPTQPWPPSLPSVSGRSIARVHPKSVSPFYALGSYDIRVSCPNGCLKDFSGPLSGRGADLAAEMCTLRLHGGPRGSCLWGTQELECMGQ